MLFFFSKPFYNINSIKLIKNIPFQGPKVQNPFIKLLANHIIYYPTPSNINYGWSFGSLAGIFFAFQIITGIFLAMHYTANVDLAFWSLEHIMRDVNNGWLLRYMHANGASMVFIMMYVHIAKALYFRSYTPGNSRLGLFFSGVVIFLLMMGTAFIGWVKNSLKWFKFKTNKKIFIYKKQINFNSSIFLISKRGFTTKTIDLNNEYSIEIQKFIKIKNLKPFRIYENLTDVKIRQQILEDTRSLSGIYLILNKKTGDYYIGSASTNRLYTRFNSHLINFSGGSKILKIVVKRDNLKSFAFLILEIFPEVVTRENNKNLLDLEDFYLKSLLPNYNILTEAGSSFGYKHSELTRIKMRSNYSQERRDRIGNLNRGKNLSSKTIELMRQKALNREKYIYSPEKLQRLKLSSKPLIVYNLDYTVFGTFPSIIEASKVLNCNKRTISRVLKTPKKILKRRWIIKLLEK